METKLINKSYIYVRDSYHCQTFGVCYFDITNDPSTCIGGKGSSVIILLEISNSYNCNKIYDTLFNDFTKKYRNIGTHPAKYFKRDIIRLIEPFLLKKQIEYKSFKGDELLSFNFKFNKRLNIPIYSI